jgi:class 3 adenylate cyclase
MEERKLVTVLFADITGSTTLGERFDPERWRVLLQRFFSAMTSTIEAWGGTVQKFMGDSVMATFGVPIVREDDAERALRAACQMLERLTDLNVEFSAQHGVSLAIRVGVNTGEVMTASDQNVVTGDAVNVAARLEHMAEPGTVLAGERTYAAARDAFVFGEPESREVRGKSAPVTVRRVLRPLTDSLDRRKGMQVAMVGREQEVEALASLFHEAMDASSPRLALISGPAGIGKSRLVREFLDLASARHPETTILRGRCPSTGDGLTYWALGELLRRECQISLDDPAAAARERLRQKVEAVLRRVSTDQATMDHTIFALAFTAGITVPGNPLDNIRPSAVQLEHPIARAELRTRAFAALLAAGAVARKRFAVAQALELHKDALRLSLDDAERAEALEGIGDDHEGAFHGDDAIPAWEGALAALEHKPEARTDRIRLIVKCAKMMCIRWGGFKVVPPARQVDGYIDAGLAAGPEPRDRGWLLAMRAYGNTRKGDSREIDVIPLTERTRAGEEAARIGQELGDIDLQVLATRALSGLAITQGAYARAMEFTRQEQALVDRIAASRDRALGLFWLALRFMDLEGRYAEGLELMERSYQLAKQLAPHDVLHATFGRLYGNAGLGRWQLIDGLHEEHLEGFKKETDMSCPFVRGGLLISATVLAHRGDLERAGETAALVPMNWSEPALPEALHGFALLACGDAPGARQEAEKILATNRRLTYEEAPLEVVLMVDALVALHDAEGLRAFLPAAERIRQAVAVLGPAVDRARGLLRLWESDAAGARLSLERALAEYDRLRNPFEAARTREYLAEALPSDARAAVLEAALQQFEQLGATPSAEHVRAIMVAGGV